MDYETERLDAYDNAEATRYLMGSIKKPEPEMQFRGTPISELEQAGQQVKEDITRVVGGGLRDMAQGAMDLSAELLTEAGEDFLTQSGLTREGAEIQLNIPAPRLPEVAEPKGMIGQIARDFVQFGSGMVVSPGSTIPKAALSDAFFDPEDGGFITMLRDASLLPEAMNFLAVDVDGESDASDRLKQRLIQSGEGAIIGAVADQVIGTLKRIKDTPDLLRRAGETLARATNATARFADEAGQAADARIAERAQDTGTTLTSGVDPMPAVDAAISAAGRAVRPSVDEMKTVLNARAEQMALPVNQRVQPSNDNVIFNLKAKPGENQSPYERNMPEQKDTPVPRAPEGKKLPLNNRGAKVIEMSDQISDVLAERARPLVGSNVQYFYHTGPLIDKAVELGISEDVAREQLKKFALNYAATSPRTMTEQNLRNASLVTAKQQRGVDLKEMIGPGGEGINEKGYPMMINPGGIHKKLVDEAAADGLNFNTNPKPATFAENVSGNLAGVTADTHAIRAVFDVMNEIEPGSIPIEFIGGKNAKQTKEFREKYLADPVSLDPATMINDTLATQKIDGQDVQTEYAIFSDIYKKVAEKIGVKPAEAQSLSWFANGQKTGLSSEPKTIVELIDERVDVTSQILGQPKDEIFKKFIQGSIPLLSLGGLTLLDTGAAQDTVANASEM
tara:strand:+ start:1197 stop:3224 length:2028 start_codon:yes stop_codon:yes gene_type:complete